MLAGVTDCRRSWKWGCRGRLALRFHPRSSSQAGENHKALVEKKREDHVSLAEWGPHGSDTDNDARSLNHGLLLLFLRYGYPGLGRGRKKDCVPVWVF